jgi:hypothetical protein
MHTYIELSQEAQRSEHVYVERFSICVIFSKYFDVPGAMRQKAGPVSIVSSGLCYTSRNLTKINMYRDNATRQISMELARQRF